MTRSPLDDPIPVSPAAARLEWVRAQAGYDTLKAFWRDLTRSTGYDVSYAGVHNYHAIDGGREPPVGYLVAVSDFTGADVGWLVRGQGEPSSDRAAMQLAAARSTAVAMPELGEETLLLVERALDAAFPYFDLPAYVRLFVLETWQRTYKDMRDQMQRAKLGRSEIDVKSLQEEAARRLSRALAGPMSVYSETSDVYPSGIFGHLSWKAEAYTMAVCRAVAALLPTPQGGRLILPPGHHRNS